MSRACTPVLVGVASLVLEIWLPFNNGQFSLLGHRRNEMEKRRHYEERIRNVDHGTFTPLVFTTSCGTGPAASIFFKRLASMLAAKHQKPYAHVLGWIRCRLSFSLLRSSIVCLRGARSAYHRPIHSFHSVDLALAEGRVLT